MTTRPLTAFVLAGGASLGAMQAGMLRALYERRVTADLLVATSAGALNAAFLATRPQTVETADNPQHIQPTDFDHSSCLIGQALSATRALLDERVSRPIAA